MVRVEFTTDAVVLLLPRDAIDQVECGYDEMIKGWDRQ
jgi:hypothetical protein